MEGETKGGSGGRVTKAGREGWGMREGGREEGM